MLLSSSYEFSERPFSADLADYWTHDYLYVYLLWFLFIDSDYSESGLVN